MIALVTIVIIGSLAGASIIAGVPMFPPFVTYGKPQIPLVGSTYRVSREQSHDFAKQVDIVAKGLGLEGAYAKDGKPEYEVYNFTARYFMSNLPHQISLIKSTQNRDIYALTWYEGGGVNIQTLRQWDAKTRELLTSAGYAANTHFDTPAPKIYSHFAINRNAAERYRISVEEKIRELGLVLPPPPWEPGKLSNAIVPDLTYFYTDRFDKAFEQFSALNRANPVDFDAWVFWYRQGDNDATLRAWNTEFEKRVLSEGVTLMSDTDHPKGEEQPTR